MLAFFLKGMNKRRGKSGASGEGGGGGSSPPPQQPKPVPVPGSTDAKTPGTAVQTYYPPNRGFAGEAKAETLGKGTVVDRYGYDGGTFVSPQGTPTWARSLPPRDDVQAVQCL